MIIVLHTLKHIFSILHHFLLTLSKQLPSHHRYFSYSHSTIQQQQKHATYTVVNQLPPAAKRPTTSPRSGGPSIYLAHYPLHSNQTRGRRGPASSQHQRPTRKPRMKNKGPRVAIVVPVVERAIRRDCSAAVVRDRAISSGNLLAII